MRRWLNFRFKFTAFLLLIVVCLSMILGVALEPVLQEHVLEAYETRTRTLLKDMAAQESLLVAADDADDADDAEVKLLNRRYLADIPSVCLYACYDRQGRLRSFFTAGRPGTPSMEGLRRYGRTNDVGIVGPFLERNRLELLEQPIFATATNARPFPIGSILLVHDRQSVVASLQRTQADLRRVTLIAGALTVVLAFGLARRFTAPLHALIQGTKRLGGGDYKVQVKVRSRDELGRLAQLFNHMVVDVAVSRNELLRRRRTLEEQVRQRTEEWHEAVRKLQSLDQRKDAFLSSVSHEFRTPLTSIRAFVEILSTLDYATDRPTFVEFSNIIGQEADRLGGMVDKLLDLVRLDSGEQVTKPRLVKLQMLVQQAIDGLPPGHQPRRAAIEVDVPDDLPAVFWDPDLTTRLLQELTQNAVHFAPADSVVRVKVELDGEDVVIRIQDQGPGIPEEAHTEVFERFGQLGNLLTDKPVGLGLGMPICREIVQRHSGTIRLEAGSGTTVVIKIPRLPAALATGEPVVTSDAERPRPQGPAQAARSVKALGPKPEPDLETAS